MIDPICWICDKELLNPGALLFDVPYTPSGLSNEQCTKYHICKDCFRWIKAIVNTKKSEDRWD